MRLGALGFSLWLAGAVAAWGLWFESDRLAGAAQRLVGLTVPGVWFTVLAVATTVGLLMALPAFLAAMSAPALSDSYLRGYTDGLTRGVNRALRSPRGRAGDVGGASSGRAARRELAESHRNARSEGPKRRSRNRHASTGFTC